MNKQKRILIKISDDNGNYEQYSAFSHNKIEHITKTKQWEYVLNKIIESFEKNNDDGDFIWNPEIKE